MSERQEFGVLPIDAYLDGLMLPEEAAAFERRMAAEPGLRAEVELQRKIDAWLRATMMPPAAKEISAGAMASAGDDAGLPIPMRRGVPGWLKVAAVIAILSVSAWVVGARPWENWGARAPSTFTANAVLKRIQDEGFKPEWVCDTDAKFLAYTKEKLGIQFLVKPAAGVQLVGWSYAPGLLSEAAQVLLVKAGGQDVIVAMGPRGEDREVRVEGSELHVHRKVYRGVVMYEITKLDHPVVLDAIEDK
jgi:anti-sigma factor RsiW